MPTLQNSWSFFNEKKASVSSLALGEIQFVNTLPKTMLAVYTFKLVCRYMQ